MSTFSPALTTALAQTWEYFPERVAELPEAQILWAIDAIFTREIDLDEMDVECESLFPGADLEAICMAIGCC